ncbi:protein rolling stone [Exaiptasia diaphana]|uniref:Protein rolling stone n=1 Tax=Exaiptasia diaphana TaxID=2652724 RepID=A0A913XNM4_EXADI|nr:protein rolling stone [Exaiptasia diaphana]KXJ25417.1 Protein rolling stone [Exaiptasia diaphana]
MLSFKQEFQLKNFKFNYRPVKDFVTSPWFPTPVLIIYRCVFAIYSTTWITYRLFAHDRFRKVVTMFYMTNWSYFTLINYFSISAGITIIHYIKKRQGKEHVIVDDVEKGQPRDDETRWYHKMQWFFYSVASTQAIGVTLFFWLFDYDGMGITLSDVNVHVLNSVFMLIDHSLSSMPVRVLHVVYPMAFILLYMIATVLYWALISKEYIYKKMDYSTNPGLAVGLLLAAMFIIAPVVHSFYYATYRLRAYLAAKLTKDDSEELGEEMQGK